jgi:hypothetical protein
MIEELQYKSDSEVAIVGLNPDATVRRNIELAVIRISDDSFGVRMHCEKRNQQAPPGVSAMGALLRALPGSRRSRR